MSKTRVKMDISDYKAGIYKQQYQYNSFSPTHINHKWTFSDPEVHELLSNADRMLGELKKIAIAHYQFETVHPFLDGNGRLGRLIIALYLASFGLLHKPALYISDYLERNKTKYVDHLNAVRESDQMKEWLIFFLHGVVETAEECPMFSAPSTSSTNKA